MSTSAVARTLQIISALKGRTISGMGNGDIAKATSLSPATVNRILGTMIEQGFVTLLDNGRYALSVKMLQIAQAHANEIGRATDRINELNQRVHAGAHQ